MATKKLTDLVALSTPVDADLLLIRDDDEPAVIKSKKTTFLQFMDSIRVATTSIAGFLSGADKTKLDGIEALADVTDAANVSAAGAVIASAPAITAEFDFAGNTIKDHALKLETISDANWNGASSFDYADGTAKSATRTNACTPDITNWPAAGESKVTFYLAQGAGAVTWTTLVDKWEGGSVPTLGAIAGDVDLIVVTTIDGGTTIYGAHVGTFSAP